MNFFTFLSFCSLILNTTSFLLGGGFKLPVYQAPACDGHSHTPTPRATATNNTVQPHYSTFLSSYYSNLVDNIGRNYKNTCGYVAIGMLLSYYDTFLDDNIVPEQFDVHSEGTNYNMVDRGVSPGIRNEGRLVETYASLEGIPYMQAVANNLSNTHLQAKLFSIGLMLGSGNGIFMNEISNILHYYLINYLGYSDDDFETSGKNSIFGIGVRDYAIQKVKQGYPVMIVAYKNLAEGHVVIAHDYDETTGELYVNFGWGGRDTVRDTLENHGFNRYTDAMIIDWNFNNSNRGYNYLVNNQAYRYDNQLLNHKHHGGASLSYSYIVNDITKHNVHCTCGHSWVEDHGNFYSNFPNPNITCGLCGYTIMNIEDEHEVL